MHQKLTDILELQIQMADLLIWVCDVLEEMREPEGVSEPRERPGDPPRRCGGASGHKGRPKRPRPTLH